MLPIWVLAAALSLLAVVTCSLGNQDNLISPQYHHTWSVHILPNTDPGIIAAQLHMDNLGQIGQIKDHYLFRYNKHPRRSKRHSEDITDKIFSHPHIIFTEQQKILIRKKRSIDEQFSFNDEYFKKQWYLFTDKNNITGAWVQGVTGRGIVVTILDDGLERTHPDLVDNYESHASTDLNDNDDDPMPRYDITNENKHGTRCAGEVASAADNHYCGVGAAYHSRIGGVRMLDGEVTDAIEAKAIGLRPEFIDIYSASWGPDDDGRTVDGPGRLTKQSFLTGIEEGRDGLGSIFVWASGNGGVSNDNCNCDGYTNSIWTLSIGATSETGQKPWYAEECSSTMAVTYSSGASKEKQIMSTDLHSKCTERHTGTSAAAPLAAGIFALVLQANPTLTWRDLQHLVVRTSRARNLQQPEWHLNGIGRNVSHKFGYGVIDAGGLVSLAQLWNNVPKQYICETKLEQPNKNIGADKEVEFSITTDGCDAAVQHLEHIQAVVTIAADKRGDISLRLESPARGTSTLLTARKYDGNSKGFMAWPFLTVHNWGENPIGKWKLYVKNNGVRNMKLEKWNLRLHGTATMPDLRNTSRPIPDSGNITDSECHVQCDAAFGCHGSGPTNCSVCKHYMQQSTNSCVEICGIGEHLNRKGTICVKHCDVGEWVTSAGQCDECNELCDNCDGGSQLNCTSCKTGLYFDPTQHTCVTDCPPNMLTRDVECVSCHADCLTCTDVGYDKCLTCKPSLFFYNNRCLQSCPQGMFANSTTQSCLECSTGCSSCFGPLANTCLSCNEGLYLGNAECLASCPTSYYTTPGTNECRQCHWSCDTCTGATSHDCALCIHGLYKDDGLCVKPCPEGKVANDTTRSCDPCHHLCYNCYGTRQDECRECGAGFKLLDPVQEESREPGSSCVPICDHGEYSYYNECRRCDASCASCAGPNATQCTGCDVDVIQHNGQCLSSCPTGFYQDGVSCYHCDNAGSCEKCSNSVSCDVCRAGYTRSLGKCVNPCEQGQYINQQTKECGVCAAECSACDGPDSYSCTRCKEDDVNALIDRYGVSSEVYCGGCLSECELCSQPYNNYCLSCNPPHSLLPDAQVPGRATCVDTCPAGTFPAQVSERAQCKSCHKSCAECDGDSSNSCTLCRQGHVLEGGRCLQYCSASFYREEGLCKPCSNTCKTCRGGGTEECLSCPPGSVHLQQQCVTSCTAGYYKSGDTCIPCHPTCTQCVGGAAHQCSACITGFILSEDRCTNTCSQGMYNDKVLNFCKPCHVSCSNCTGEGQGSCLSCKSPLVKNPTYKECWPCCTKETTQHCCYCSQDTPSLLCTEQSAHHVDKDTSSDIEGIKTTAGVIVGVIVLLALFTLFGYVLFRWRKTQQPVNYMLLSEHEEEAPYSGLINEAFEEEIMTMIHT